MSHPLRLVLDSQRRYYDAAVDCEAAVFGAWYDEAPDALHAGFSPWEDSAVFLVVADASGDVHAAARLIPPSAAGFVTLNDIARPPWSVDAARSFAAAGLEGHLNWDVATMGARPRATGGPNLAAALYHGLIRTTLANGLSSFTAILEHRVRRMLNMVGIHTQTLPGTSPQPYYGSTSSTPVYARMGPMLDRQRRELPDAHRLLTLGVGLRGVAVAPLQDFVLRADASVDVRGRGVDLRPLGRPVQVECRPPQLAEVRGLGPRPDAEPRLHLPARHRAGDRVPLKDVDAHPPQIRSGRRVLDALCHDP